VSHRPLVFVSGLTVGDYVLWNWSLNGNHDVLALVAGLTLPPLAVACVWLLALSGARLLARSHWRHATRASRARLGARLGLRGARRVHVGRGLGAHRRPHQPAPGGAPGGEPTSATTSAGRSSRKLAA
jgi:hypothetical protein